MGAVGGVTQELLDRLNIKTNLTLQRFCVHIFMYNSLLSTTDYKKIGQSQASYNITILNIQQNRYKLRPSPNHPIIVHLLLSNILHIHPALGILSIAREGIQIQFHNSLTEP